MNSDFIAHGELACHSGLNLPIQSSLQRLLNIFKRKTVFASSISLHNQAFEQLKQISIILKACDQQKFHDPDFLLFVSLRNSFARETGELEGLKKSLQLFRVAIEAKNSFLKIEQTELMYRSSKQQEFYHLVFELLARNVSKVTFYKKVHQKLHKIIEGVKSEHGQKALKSYVYALDNLSQQDELGLRLLYLFKKLQLTNSNYSILKTVSDLVIFLGDKNLQDLDSIVKLVRTKNDTFIKVGRIIGIPFAKNHPKTYALMLQYVALRQKYKILYYQFKKMKKVLHQWQTFYQIINDIRSQYPFLEYKQPKEFTETIPGLNIYEKYQDYLK
jgi:hypothetical protein